jgi:hypothetical protein
MPKLTTLSLGLVFVATSFLAVAGPAAAKCKGGGLTGAINCITKEMDKAGKAPASASSTEKKSGVTTTSVRNPDGTRTVTKTDKNGKVLSKKVVGKEPTSASATDTKTGITTTSVRNPDGTRTVTRTDKNGKVLSKKVVRKEPTSASATDTKTGITTTSVRNPDGTRTVTSTDKDGNILSREKVH